MKLKSMLPVLLIAGGMFTTSCKSKPKDADLKASVEAAIANPAVMVDVKECDVTLSGTVADEMAKSGAETSAKAVENVKMITNNLSVTPPPPPPAPVVIEVDSVLIKGVASLEKSFTGVSAAVKDGVVTLTGTVKRDALPRVMQAVMALKPKSVDNKLTIK